MTRALPSLSGISGPSGHTPSIGNSPCPFPSSLAPPRVKGAAPAGIELDLKTGGKPKDVSLAEVAGRFAQAVEEGTDFPFLHNFSYRTTGWKWLVARHLDPEERKRLAGSLAVLLEEFLADAVECSSKDIQVTFVAKEGELRVVDGTPGGNGLSEALLRDGRVAGALGAALKAVRAHGEKGPDTFKRFLAEYRADTDLTAKEIADALDKLARAWNG